MEIGKLPNELLEKIVLNNIEKSRTDVLIHAGIGKDCAVVEFGDYGCVLSSDPITGAMSNLGSLAIHISCNDIAASGAEPIGVMLTMLMPPSVTEEEVEKIISDAGRTASELNVEIIGGHTEITDAVNKTVLITTVVGKQPKHEVLSEKLVTPGDSVIITKYAGIEGTSIIANDLEAKLRGKVSEDLIQEGKELSKYLSVLKEGRLGNKFGAKYMHDVTEGGLLGAIWETAVANGVGIKITEEKIPMKKSTVEISKVLNIDPLKLISSGSMIVVMEAEKAKIYIAELETQGIKGTIIGEITESKLIMESDGIETEIESPKSDEIYKVI